MNVRILQLVAIGMASSVAVMAGVVVPLHIGSTNSVVNEQGVMLKGTGVDSPAYGFPYVEGEIVQILGTVNGHIDRPGLDGSPTNANNSVLMTRRIGQGVDPAGGPTGQFSASLSSPPTNGVFVRIFNAAAQADASFYADSQVFTNSASSYVVFVPDISGTVKALDEADSDGDGLNNSWEKSLKTDPARGDTDNDGVNDYNEFLTGTQGTNAASYLGMVQVLPNPAGGADVFWASVSGKTYQVEYAPGDLVNSGSFSNVSERITASGLTTQFSITNALSLPRGFFRVKWVQ